MKYNPAIGQEREHQLVGSVAWAEARRADADAGMRTFDLNSAIVGAIRDWLGAQHATGGAIRYDDEVRGSSHDTETGVQLGTHFVNVVDINHAVERLSDKSETDHARYLACAIGARTLVRVKDRDVPVERWTTQDVGERAAEEGVARDDIHSSLKRARRFLREAILDKELTAPDTCCFWNVSVLR